jgi:hypothetical protein
MYKIALLLLGLPVALNLSACTPTGQATDKSGIIIQANPQSLLADGVTQSMLTITATAADGISPYSGSAMLSCSAPVKFGQSEKNTDTITITNGAGTETVTCDGKANPSCYGPQTIYGYLESNDAKQSGAVMVTFEAPDAGPVDAGDAGPMDAGHVDAGNDAGVFVPNSLVSLGASPAYLGVDYQASYNVNPIGTFTFKVLNTTADAGVAGIPVTFGLQTQTTSQLLTTMPVLSDSTGSVQAQVKSGSAGSVTVTASYTVPQDGGMPDGGQSISAQATISVIGTQPSWSGSSIACNPQNLPVFAHGNLPCGISSTQNLQTTCVANLADRFGNKIGIPVAVNFYSEAGTWANPPGSLVLTPDFGQPNAGTATAYLQTNKPLPLDVDPGPGEPSYLDTCAAQPHTYNPRDGLVTVIAVFRGEEGFVVPPTTGQWAPGIEFTDLPQPFVDEDDSSVYKTNDVCPGNGGTGTCAPPNGTWDSNTSIFVETRILYTGSSTGLGAEPAAPTIFASGPIVVPAGGQYNGTVTFADLNLNIYNTDATQGVTISSGPNQVQIGGVIGGQQVHVPDQLGMHVTQLRECDAGITYDDAGTPVSTPICNLRTVINSYLGGYTGPYNLKSTSAVSDGGGLPICITAAGDVPPDLAPLYTFCGTAY